MSPFLKILFTEFAKIRKTKILRLIPIIINAEKFSYTPNINLKLKVIENINIAWTLLISTLYLFISIIKNTHGFSSYDNWLCRLSIYCYMEYLEEPAH